MTDNIFFLGHISMDSIKNINGSNYQPGGAALYSAMAAKTLLDDVNLISIIGDDYEFHDALQEFPKRYIKIFKMPSTRFVINYNEQWEAEYVSVGFGAGSRLSISNIPSEILGTKSIFHLCPLRPSKVERFVKKIKDLSPDTTISINTWIGYMKNSKSREILKKIAGETDFFILNESEAKILTQTSSVSSAMRLIKAKVVIITLGDLGTIIKKEKSIQFAPSLNYQPHIVDTTGAGDVWCGSFLAAYRITNDLMKSVSTASIVTSIKCSGWNYSKIWKLRFRSVEDTIEYILGIREGSMQKRMPEYL